MYTTPISAGRTSCPLSPHCYVISCHMLEMPTIISIDGIEMMVQKVLFLDAQVLS